MLRNYLIVAFRNLWLNKSFACINIFGLSVGMASAILVMLFIVEQVSFDRFHSKKDRIYQVYNLQKNEGELQASGGSSSLLAPVIKMNYPQVEEVFRVNWSANLIFSAGQKHLEALGYFTDPGFLKTLNFPLTRGDKNTALNKLEAVILTESFAKKLFGNEDPMGQSIRIDSNANFSVTGIIKDPPKNTRFEFEYLLNFEYRKKINWDIPKWNDYGITTYILLKPGVSEEEGNKLFRNIVSANAPEVKIDLFLHPMSKWHLYSKFRNGKIAGGNIESVRIFGIIGAFLLLIACINYMNLSTARSEKRAREVGIRKVIGAKRKSLVWQFIGESVILAFLAGGFALVFAEIALRPFNQLVYYHFEIPYDNAYFWISGIGFILFTGFLAGSYPALYLSAHKPIRVLKGSLKAVNALITPRKVLVVFQFSFAIVFIICTIVIYKQIRFGQKRDIGYKTENLVYVYLRGDIPKHYQQVRSTLYASGAVESVTRTNSPISFLWTWDDTFEWKDKDPVTRPGIATIHSDDDFATTMGIEILQGRDLHATTYPTDTMAVLLNEASVEMMKLTNPVGQYIKNSQGNWKIVGVVKNFSVGSPYEPVPPIIIQGPRNWFGTLTFRLKDDRPVSESLAKITPILKRYNPDYPSDFIFADKDHASKFNGDQHLGKLAALFAGLAIFISCLGLYALASYMATNRIKEIGVRKVLGASVASVTTLLSKDFLKLVVIAFIIASPIAWWMMSSWLSNYPFRITLSWWIFALTGLVSILIALLTVSHQAIKTALSNPVKSLRTE